MESLLLVWLIANTLLLFVSLIGVFVLLRDRDRQKSLYRSQLKEHIRQLEQLAEITKRLEKVEKDQAATTTTVKDWVTLLSEQINGLIELSKRIETTSGTVGDRLKTAKEILEIVQSRQSTLRKLISSANLLASTK